MSEQLQPFYGNIQAHYDLSNDYFALFLDPSMTYSCAYFDRDDLSLHEAQLAKFDLALGKIDLKPGHTLLDIGCGWGASSRRAAEQYDCHVIALTLSKAQHEFALESLAKSPLQAGSVDYRLQGWEEYDDGPVDRILSIAAFEAFRRERYDAFFEKCHRLLPEGGKMLLHTIVWFSVFELERRGIEVTREDVEFFKFVNKKIFVDGQLVPPSVIVDHCRKVGLEVTRIHELGPHYARTLDHWAANLAAAKEQAVAVMNQEVYDRFMKYLTGCAKYFRSGHIDIMQFSLSKTAV
jgi:cyclopropane-fatty-acyl-phospholipid synthase